MRAIKYHASGVARLGGIASWMPLKTPDGAVIVGERLQHPRGEIYQDHFDFFRIWLI